MHELKQAYQKHFKVALGLAALIHILGGLSWNVWSALFEQREIAVRLAPYTEIMEVQLAEPDIEPSGPMMLPSETPETEDQLSEIIPVPDPVEEVTPMEEMAIADTPLSTGQTGPSGTSLAPGTGAGGGRGTGLEPPAAPAVSGPGYDERPRVLKKVEPEYPRLAKMAGIEGLVVLSILIDETGKLEEAQVVKSLGNTGCDEAALIAVRQWVFAPATRQGRPIAARITVPIQFNLKLAR